MIWNILMSKKSWHVRSLEELDRLLKVVKLKILCCSWVFSTVWIWQFCRRFRSTCCHILLWICEDWRAESTTTAKHRESLKSVIIKVSRFAHHCNPFGSEIFSKITLRSNAIAYYDILFEDLDIDVSFSA